MKIQGEGTQSYLENSTPLSNFLFLQVEPIIFSWSTSIRIIIVDPLSTQQCKCLIPVSSFRLLLCVCVCVCVCTLMFKLFRYHVSLWKRQEQTTL